MRGTGDDVGGRVDSEGADGGAATKYARFRDEDRGEAWVGGGAVGSRVADEPPRGGDIPRPQEDGARRGRGGGGQLPPGTGW